MMTRTNKGAKMYDYKNLKVFKKSQVNGLTKHLSGIRFSIPMDERRDLTDAIIKRCSELGMSIDYCYADGERFTFNKPRKITKEQSDFGKQWLKEYFFKKNGEPRQGQRAEYVSDRVLKIAKSVKRFEFVGVIGLFNGIGEMCQFVPVYRAYNSKNEYFDYAPVHWGQPIIEE